MQGAVPINGSVSNGEYNEVESNKNELIETLTSSEKMIGLLCVSTSFPSGCSERSSRGTEWELVYWGCWCKRGWERWC